MSGPEGTPNSVARLAQIEAAPTFENPPQAHAPGLWVRLRAEDRNALVEIAKDMERIEKTCDGVVQRIAEAGEPPAALSGTQIDAERMRDFARSALARLDRPSSDGTADSGAAEEGT